MSTTEKTDAALGFANDGNAAFQFAGGVQLHRSGFDPVFTQGGVNLGTGQVDLKGYMAILPVTFVARLDVETGYGSYTACVIRLGFCWDTEFQVDQDDPASEPDK